MKNECIIQSFLESISEICFFQAERVEKELFNIFNVLRIENDEVKICRFLGEILNPLGKHKMNIFPLKSFLSDVLGVEDEDEPSIRGARVVLEEPIDHDSGQSSSMRRVDIVIHTLKRVYPIEVKVWAGDQSKQLFDYYHYFFGNDDNSFIYYLTPDGHAPSWDSKRDLNDERIKIISFEKHITKWLETILQKCGDYLNGDFISVLNQFKGVVEKMNGDKPMVERVKNSIGFKSKKEKQNCQALYLLCCNHEELMKDLEIKYIKEYIKVGDSFEIVDLNNDDYIQNDYYPKLDRCFIKKKDDSTFFKTWISIDRTGLYLLVFSGGLKLSSPWVKAFKDKNDYFWKRVENNGEKVLSSSDIMGTFRYEEINIIKDLEELSTILEQKQ